MSSSTLLALLRARSVSGRARALYRGPSFSSRAENARASSTAEICFALSFAFHSVMVEKKSSSLKSAMGSGFELESRLGGHRDFVLQESLGIASDQLFGLRQLIGFVGCLSRCRDSKRHAGQVSPRDLHTDSLYAAANSRIETGVVSYVLPCNASRA